MKSKFKLFKKIEDVTNRIVTKNKFLSTLFLVIFCIILALPAVFIAKSEIMLPLDYVFEDSTYQGKNDASDDIVIINIDRNNSVVNENDIDLDVLASVINSLSESASVVGVDLRICTNNLGDFYNVITKENVIFGSYYDVDGSDLSVAYTGKIETFSLKKSEDLMDVDYYYTNLFLDTDGIIRHYMWEKDEYTSFAKACYKKYVNLNSLSDNSDVKVSCDGFSVLRYVNQNNNFKTYSIDDVINQKVSMDAFYGKIVLIGTNDVILGTNYSIPTSKNDTTGSIEVQANAIYDLIYEETGVEFPLWSQITSLGLCTAILLYIIFKVNFYISVGVAVFACILNGLDCSYFANEMGLYAHPLYMYISVIFCLFGGFLLFQARKKYDVAKEYALLENRTDIELRDRIFGGSNSRTNGIKRNCAILVADIRNFTSIIDNVKPESSVEILKKYFLEVEKIVRNNNGFLIKLLGDSFMAFWEDGDTDEKSAFLACKAAYEIAKKTSRIDDEIFQEYGKEISFGIGVDYGECIIGDTGSLDRKEFTIIGNAVNGASRLESLASRGIVLISSKVRKIVGNKIEATLLLDKIYLKTKFEQMDVYSLESITEDPKILDEPLNSFRQMKERYILYILGCRGSFQTSGKRFNEFGGQTTCSIIKTGSHAIVLDCGTGLYEAKDILKDCTKIDVVLSHVHYDHCLGLLDWNVFPKEASLNFYGNFKKWLGLRTINELFHAPFWPADLTRGVMHQIPEEGKMLYLGDDITFWFYNAPHPDGSIVSHIMVGDKRICNMVDCEDSEGLPLDVIKNCDILIYDGMYDDNDYSGRIGWGHSTWQEGCKLAKNAEVKNLIIAHHSPTDSDAILLQKERNARNIFENTTFARSGMVIKL